MSVRAIVLAAGQGTRMKSSLPKVLHPVAGAPLLKWVVDAVRQAGPDQLVVVVGHGADEVEKMLPDGVQTVIQKEQLGTGHAARQALDVLGDVEGDTVLVVPGDSPLISAATLSRLIERRAADDAAVALLTTRMADPTGYGRVVRDGAGAIVGIIEERDADDGQRLIDEVAVSTYAFEGGALLKSLSRVGSSNDQGEIYLTDAIGVLAAEKAPIVSIEIGESEGMGVNDHEQLADAARRLRRRLNQQWMSEGVRMVDPERVYLDATVQLEAGVTLLPDVYLEGSTTVAAGAQVGPSVFSEDSQIGPESHVWYSVLRGATVGARAEVGPFASLRPGTVLGPDSKAGTFVETKNAIVGPHSKIPHLSYVGDAEIGEGSNIGAGTITCNYDGFEKHATRIGDGVRIGSDTMLVAPVTIGDGAWTGAGSTITKDVSPGALAVERAEQREIPDYAAKKRAKKAPDE